MLCHFDQREKSPERPENSPDSRHIMMIRRVSEGLIRILLCGSRYIADIFNSVYYDRTEWIESRPWHLITCRHHEHHMFQARTNFGSRFFGSVNRVFCNEDNG